MRILGLDLGGVTGWAILSSAAPLHGYFDLRNKHGEGGGMPFLKFRNRLGELLAGIDLVVYEEVRFAATTDAAIAWGGFRSILLAECEARAVPVKGYTPSQIKRHATGKGTADKQAMLAAAQARWPAKDHNEADALWCADLGWGEFGEAGRA